MKKYKLQALMKKNGITFFNMSGLSLKKLLNAPDHIGDSFKTTPNRSLGFGIKLSSSPLSLHIRCNLKPKYHPMVLLPLSASSRNTLFLVIRLLWHTRKRPVIVQRTARNTFYSVKDVNLQEKGIRLTL